MHMPPMAAPPYAPTHTRLNVRNKMLDKEPSTQRDVTHRHIHIYIAAIIIPPETDLTMGTPSMHTS